MIQCSEIWLGVDPGQDESDHTAAFRHPDDGHSIAGTLSLDPLTLAGAPLDILLIRHVTIEKPGTIPPHFDKTLGRMVFPANSKDIDACIAAANILAYRFYALGIPVFMITRQKLVAAQSLPIAPGSYDSRILAYLAFIGALTCDYDKNGKPIHIHPEYMRGSHARSALIASMYNPIGEAPWRP